MYIAVSVVILGLLHFFVIYPLWFSPLSKLPGPKHLKLSRWFILNKSRQESRNEYLQGLHEKYGDVVQIGPNEVAFNSLHYLKLIYTGNFPKEFQNSGTGFYSQFGNFNTRNLFSTGDSQTHVNKKKSIAKVYSKSNIIRSASYVKNKVDQAWIQIDENIGRPLNVYSMFLALAMDVVSGFEYGARFSTNFVTEIDHTNRDPCKKDPLFAGFQESSSMWFYTTLAPRWWNLVAWIYGIGEKSGKAQQWVYDKFLEALKTLKSGTSNSHTDPTLNPAADVLSVMYRDTADNSAKNNTIASEIADHIAAGHETTGITLTYICWQLSRPWNQKWQHRIHQECYSLTDLQELDRMPILHSVIQEACRVHAAIPGSEPRYVPAANRHNECSAFRCKLQDNTTVVIPPGTVVSCQPWSLHQLETTFGPNPRCFDPQRWLPQDEEPLQEYERRLASMNNALFTFGQGNRMCLGMHLALLEMKYCIARLYSQYTTAVSPEWATVDSRNSPANSDVLMGRPDNSQRLHLDSDLMRMVDSYTTRPWANQCWLTFQKRQLETT